MTQLILNMSSEIMQGRRTQLTDSRKIVKGFRQSVQSDYYYT